MQSLPRTATRLFSPSLKVTPGLAGERLALVLALVCCLIALPAQAQINTASLAGLVADPSGAVVPHAHVTVTNASTSFTRETETDGAGYYFFPALPIGTYAVSVAKEGFANAQQQVELNTAEKARRDFALQVGSSAQTVNVEAEGSTLSTGDASIGSVITNDVIQQTPLYQRNWDDLLRTVPGVQVARFTQQGGATSSGRTGSFNVHGIHSLQNNFMLDGIDNNTISENVQELSTQAAHPSVDTIQEFAIVTNPYSAEYGRAPGAAVSVNTKGGTNKFHGLVYEYLRNQYFDANIFFAQPHSKNPENNQHQFGGNFGGPILRNRLFGFFNYEGTRIKQGVLRLQTVPLPNERIGDFSPAAAAAAGLKPYPTIYDPLTNTPFPNNQIPAPRLDKAVKGLMALFPLPNLPGNLNNFQRTALVTDDNDSYHGRVDWTATHADNVFARYSYSNRNRFVPGYFGGIADGTSTSAWGRQVIKSYSAALGWTHVFSPVIVNDFHLGFIRNYSFAKQDPFGKNAADQYVPGIPNNPATAGGVPLTQFTNFTFIGSPDFLPKSQVPQQFEWVDSVSIALGAHALKFGGTLYAPMRNIFQDEPGTRGDLNFSGNFTCRRNPPPPQNPQVQTCVAGTGLSYADGLIGYVQSTQLTNVHFVDQRLWMLSGFVQDDWKALPKLTLNLGLRYDFATPALEARDQMANFDPAGNGGAGALVFAKGGSLRNRGLVQINTLNFGPRFGFAYSLNPKTVVRGGYGLYYSLFERYGSENQMALNPPFLINKTPAALSTSTTPVLIAQNGFPANFLDPSTIDLTKLQAFHLRVVNPKAPFPTVQQWSFGFQRELPWNLTAEANYVGTKSTHLDVINDLNQPVIANGAVVPNAPLPFPNFGYIEHTNSIGYGNYNGLEASLSRRFSNGLSARAAYTYSHSLDNTPQELESGSGSPPDGRNFQAWYGRSDFDIPHRVAVNYLYELPIGRGKAFLSHGVASYVFGGFRTSGVFTHYSGRPFTVNAGGQLAGALDPYGQATATVQRIGTPHIVGKPRCWYFVSKNSACTAAAPGLTDAFALPLQGVVGNNGRNTLRGPHVTVFDAALLREFSIVEKANLEFRWEVFNVTNTPEFGQPNNNFSSGSAGTITSLAGDPRVMQFALRLSF